jgi:hypothetical protein
MSTTENNARREVVIARLKAAANSNRLPETSGVWMPVRSKANGIVGWMEMFAGPQGQLFSVPDSSRWIEAAN